MEFRILGPLEVRDENRRVDLGGGRQRTLLAVMLLHANELVSSERLIDALWGERPPPTAPKSLQNLVSQLRRSLASAEDGLIATRARGYVLRVDPEAIDVRRFERLVGDGRRALAAGEAADAADVLGEALALWRGPALEEFAYEGFAQAEIARLEELRLRALEDRIEADLALGHHEDVIAELERLVAAQPLRERLRSQLMLALYRSGRQAEALQAYQDLRRLLAEELGLEPGSALQQLEKGILTQDPALEHRVPGAAAQSGPTAERAVPTGTVTFLFSDIEGSTRLVHRLGDEYGTVLELHHRLLRVALGKHLGQEIDSQGDAFFFAFRRARDAVAAAVEAQRSFSAADWPEGVLVRVRIGIHTGEPALAPGGYHGLDVVRAARISAAAHGGQILVSSATRDLVCDGRITDVSFRDLGEHPLKDFERAPQLFQVTAPGLPDQFPPPRTTDGAAALDVGGREEELVAAAQAAVGAEEAAPRRFRRRLLLVGAAALVLGGAAALAAWIALGQGESAPTVVPDSVVRIDPKTNRIVDVHRVGRFPGPLVVTDGHVFVSNIPDSTISRVSTRSGKVDTFGGVKNPVGIAADADGGIWVGSARDGEVVRFDARTLVPVDRIRVGEGGTPIVVTGGGALWVSEWIAIGVPGRDGGVWRIRLAGERVPERVLSDPPLGIGFGDGAAWATSFETRSVRRIDAATGAVESIAVGSQSFGDIAVAFGAAWVPSQGRNAVWRVNTLTRDVDAIVEVGKMPFGMAAGFGSVWVVNRDDGTVSRIDPRTNSVVATIVVGFNPGGIAVGDGAVWVAVGKGDLFGSIR